MSTAAPTPSAPDASAPPAAAMPMSMPMSSAQPMSLAVPAVSTLPPGMTAANPRFLQWAKDNEISRQTGRDLLSVISRVKVVLLVDDSGSMNTGIVEPGSGGARNMFAPSAQKTRWDEAQQAAFEIVKLLTTSDHGLDVWFFHRPSILNVTNPSQLASSFANRPAGGTPLLATIQTLYNHYSSYTMNKQPLLLTIVGDGEPSDGSAADLARVLNSKPPTIHVSFVECNDNEEEMAFMDSLDGKIVNFHNSDDYRLERQRVQNVMGTQYKFNYVDYIVMALLAPFTPGYFLMDQGKAARLSITPLIPMDPTQLNIWTEGLIEIVPRGGQQYIMAGAGRTVQPTMVMMQPGTANANGQQQQIVYATAGQPAYYPPGQPVYQPPQAVPCCTCAIL